MVVAGYAAGKRYLDALWENAMAFFPMATTVAQAASGHYNKLDAVCPKAVSLRRCSKLLAVCNV